MLEDKRVRLSWLGSGLAYAGHSESGGPSVVIDGSNEQGPSPMDMLLLGVAACMGIDIQAILRKSRVRLDALDFRVSGTRAGDYPRRYTRISFDIAVAGPGPGDAARVERAVELSRDKYCSALNSLRPDIEITMHIRNTTRASLARQP